MLWLIKKLHGWMKKRTDKYSETPLGRWEKIYKLRFFTGHLALLAMIIVLVAVRYVYLKLFSL